MLTFKRGARKYTCDYGVNDIYKFYQTTAREPVDRKTWKSIVDEFNTISLRSYRIVCRIDNHLNSSRF